jgi:hypothetical protein
VGNYDCGGAFAAGAVVLEQGLAGVGFIPGLFAPGLFAVPPLPWLLPGVVAGFALEDAPAGGAVVVPFAHGAPLDPLFCRAGLAVVVGELVGVFGSFEVGEAEFGEVDGEAWFCVAAPVGGATAPVGGFTAGDVCVGAPGLPACGAAATRDCATAQLAQPSIANPSIADKSADLVFDIFLALIIFIFSIFSASLWNTCERRTLLEFIPIEKFARATREQVSGKSRRRGRLNQRRKRK